MKLSERQVSFNYWDGLCFYLRAGDEQRKIRDYTTGNINTLFIDKIFYKTGIYIIQERRVEEVGYMEKRYKI